MPVKTTTYLIVGLGNPDKCYADTFHNVGFMCADAVAKKLDAKFTKGECRAITAHVKKGDVKIIVAKPITYMNLSGDAVNELIRKYKIERDKFLVMYDDVDLPLGSVRIRQEGTAGTHNGMRDVVAKTNTTQIYRIRVGIASPHTGDLADYVLSKIPASASPTLAEAVDNASDAVVQFVGGATIQKVMADHNRA